MSTKNLKNESKNPFKLPQILNKSESVQQIDTDYKYEDHINWTSDEDDNNHDDNGNEISGFHQSREKDDAEYKRIG
jgi:hypothetical protein